ncbi:MAG: hypothetical protein IIB08_07085 [Bacteroidetes bacterium]|nr:hypothetical protein [Bacteroidota bacterium]
MIGKTISHYKILEKLGEACLPITGKMYLIIYRQPRQGGPVRRNIILSWEKI